MPENENTTEITLDLSKLLGFDTLATGGNDAPALAQAMEDLHGKIGVPEDEVPDGGIGQT